MDLRSYLLPWILEEEFIEQIETFAIWGNYYDSIRHRNAIFRTKDKQVYAIGDLISKCYKATDDPCTEDGELKGLNRPVLLKELSDLRIKKITITFNHVFVCTDDGKVLGYGRYKYKKETGFNLPQRVSALRDLNVVDIAAGLYDNALMLLTDDGKIHHWILMQKQSCVMEIEASKLWNSKPTNVFTGSRLIHFFVLLENGQVIKMTRHSEQIMIFPKSIDKELCIIKKMVCGYSHVLLLDEDGRLFVNGTNEEGQLGLGEEVQATAPEQLAHNSFFTEKIVDIAATPSCPLSGAVTENGKVYMWGHCRGLNIFKPTLTPFSSLHEVFFHYSAPLVTYKSVKIRELPAVARDLPAVVCDSPPIACESKKPPELTNGFQENDAKTTYEPSSLVDTFYDLTIVVDSNKIPVHKAILKLRSQYFAEMFREREHSVLEIEGGDLKLYEMFLKFLYTDLIEDTLSCHQIIELLNLANKYRVETLAERCSSLIQSNINIDNVIALYKSTISPNEDPKMKSILEKLKEFCVLFTMKNEVAVVRSKEFASLSPDLAKDLILDVCSRRSI